MDTKMGNRKASMAFVAHYVEPWNWLLRWRPFRFLHDTPEYHWYLEWMWPIYALASVWYMVRKKSFDVVDDFRFGANGKISGQTILLRNFGWHFIFRQYRNVIRRRILKAVLYAQKHAEVVGLGALVKDESLTQGGEWVVNQLGDRLKAAVVHGDTLTAATILEQVTTLMQKMSLTVEDPIFVTGSTSKIGRALVLSLATRGLTVKMFTASKSRFDNIREEAGEYGNNISWATSLEDGKDCPIWVTGKSIPKGRFLLESIPADAAVINFAVPNPISMRDRKLRKDVAFYEGGLLAYDKGKTSLQFSMRLPRGLTYACHAGTMVHAALGWKHHEVGSVDLKQMPVVWAAALELGFFLPPLEEPVSKRSGVRTYIGTRIPIAAPQH